MWQHFEFFSPLCHLWDNKFTGFWGQLRTQGQPVKILVGVIERPCWFTNHFADRCFPPVGSTLLQVDSTLAAYSNHLRNKQTNKKSTATMSGCHSYQNQSESLGNGYRKSFFFYFLKFSTWILTRVSFSTQKTIELEVQFNTLSKGINSLYGVFFCGTQHSANLFLCLILCLASRTLFPVTRVALFTPNPSSLPRLYDDNSYSDSLYW